MDWQKELYIWNREEDKKGINKRKKDEEKGEKKTTGEKGMEGYQEGGKEKQHQGKKKVIKRQTKIRGKGRMGKGD